MSKVAQIQDSEFDELLTYEGLVVIDFTATLVWPVSQNCTVDGTTG
jgi:hypothetical protein